MPDGPMVDEKITILTSLYVVAIVTVMRPDSISHSQGRLVSNTEEGYIIE